MLTYPLPFLACIFKSDTPLLCQVLNCYRVYISECKEKLGKALIMMGEIGGNDYNFAFFKKDPITKIYKMVPEVVQVIKKAIKVIILYF